MKTLKQLFFCIFLLSGIVTGVTSMQAQSTGEYVSIGTGAGLNSYALGGNRQSVTVSLYKASEIQKSGNIDGLSWYANTAVSTARQVSIYLKETQDSILTADTWGNLTAGATLWHITGNDWSNTVGSNTILFDSSFVYNGNNNLIVIIQTVGTSASVSTPNVLSTQEYPYKNVRFSIGNANPIAGTAAGTLDLLRPNIQFIFNTDIEEAPVAAFVTSNRQVISSENFDNTNSFPVGWEQILTAGTYPWGVTAETSPTTNFKIVDASNVYSATVRANANIPQDAWLKSPEITLPEDAEIDFNILYSLRNGTQYAPVYLYVVIGSDTTRIWKSKVGTSTDITTPIWYEESIDLSAYANQTVRFAWRVYGPQYGGAWVAIDNVSITKAENGMLNVLEGEYLQLTDQSSGHIDSWKWILPGSEVEISTDQNPHVRYPQNGQYDVTLIVENSFGADTTYVQNIVNVIPREPLAAFKATSNSGYTRKLNYGKFIPHGGEVTFTDGSAYNPTSYTWNFENGDPLTSTQSQQTVSYNSDGEFDVLLTATNVAGSGSLLKEDFIKVSGTDSVWNMPANDPGESAYLIDATSPSKGYLTGPNEYKFTAYSEYFGNPIKGTISEVGIHMQVADRKSEIFKVEVCAVKHNGTPGAVLASADLPVSEMVSNGYTRVQFPNPAKISGPFHIVVKGFDANFNNPTMVVITTSQKQTSGTGTVYFYEQHLYNAWYAYDSPQAAQFGSPKFSLNIVPVITYTELEADTTPLAFEADGGNQSVGVTSNIDWEVISTASWITAVKNGENAISVTCDANTGGYRTGTIYINGGGEEKTIRVSQAGTAIALIANFDEAVANVKNLSWTSSPVTSATIFTWSNLQPQSGVFNAGNPIEAAIRWEVSDLDMYTAAKVTAVDLYILSQADYTIKIRRSGTIIHSQALNSVVPGQYNHVLLDSAVTIDLSEELIISYLVENYVTGTVPATYDSETPVPYKGNLIAMNGEQTFYALSELLPNGQTGNWCISATIEGNLKEKFNVYRDTEKIATVTTHTYSDTHEGSNCYTVASFLNDTTDVQTSNTACLTVTYSPGNLEALKAFLRQPSFVAGEINADRVGVIDTTAWNDTDEWVSSLVGVTFIEIGGLKHVQKIAWVAKSLAGNLVLSPCIHLETLQIDRNMIASIDVNGCTKVTRLGYSENPLNNIDISTNINLSSLDVYLCGLTTLNLSHNIALSNLLCDNNSLEVLDVSNNTALTSLTCNNNQLHSLDLSANTRLVYLVARDNQIESLLLPDQAMNNVRIQNNKLKFSTLPQRTFATYSYAPQDTIKGDPVDYTDLIDLSSEYETTVNGNTATTTFIWFDITGGTEVPITLAGSDGIFSLTQDMLGKTLRCKLTNANFPNFTGNNVLLYEVEVKTISCHAPQRVAVTNSYENNQCIAHISWTAPSTGENLFNIYRDNVLIASNVNATSYDDIDYSGTHTWCVKSACSEGEESSSSCVSGSCSVGINEAEVSQLKAYPNPTTGKVFIENAGNNIKFVQIFDMTGRLLQEYNNVANDKIEVNLDGFVQGLYFIKVDGKTIKIVKQ